MGEVEDVVVMSLRQLLGGGQAETLVAELTRQDGATLAQGTGAVRR